MRKPTTVGSMLILFFGCSCEQCKLAKQNSTTRETSTAQKTDLQSLSTEMGIPLPTGTQILWLERQAGMDDLVRAKIQMSRSAFEQLSPRLPIKSFELRAGAGRLGTDYDGWNPHATTGLRSGQTQLAGARYLTLGVADNGGEQVTLFVINHGT